MSERLRPSNEEHYLKRELRKLVQTDEHFLDFLEAGSRGGFWCWDLENPNEEWLSQNFMVLLGYPNVEVSDPFTWRRAHAFAEDFLIAQENLRRHCADPDYPFDPIVRYRHRDYSTVWVRCHGKATRDADGRAIRMFGVHTDVTALKEAERQEHDLVLARAQLYNAVVESSSDAVVVEDLDGTIRGWNRAAERMFGYSEAEALGRSITMIVPPHKQVEMRAFLAQVGRGARIEQLETTRIHKSGAQVEVSISVSPVLSTSGTILGAAKIARDMSGYRRAEARWQLVAEAAPNAMVVVNQDRKITLVNRKTEALFGYSREELLGQLLEILVPETAREKHPDHVREFFKNPQARAMGGDRELSGRRKDGTEVRVEIGLNPLDTGDGASTLASILDITERKRIEDELRRSNADLEQFAYIASHDLQEPLRMVASYTELLGQRYKGQLDEKADKYIAYAVDGARRMQRMVSDLLAYSRVGSQGKAPVPVKARVVVDHVLEFMADTIRRVGASVEVGPLPTVLADEGQLGQVFQNLLHNALKFRSEAPPRIVIRAARKDYRWIFSVGDNGIGIEMQYADRIFQMFQHLHERGKYEGSGIGLAITRRIVERHGGTIWCESELGVGTTFFFTLAADGSENSAS